MSESIRELLGYRVLTQAYSQQQFARPLVLTDTFYNNPIDVDGDDYFVFFDPAEQEPLPTNVPGSAARMQQGSDATERKASLWYSFNALQMKDTVLTALRNPNGYDLQRKGAQEVARQLNKFRWRHALLKETIISKILAKGAVHIGPTGKVLESSSGAIYSASYGIPANHQTDIGGIIAALWSVAGTKINDHLTDIRDMNDQEGTEPLTDIWVNAKNKKHLVNNTQFGEWAKNNPNPADVILRGSMIPDLWGFNWHFVGGQYKAADGTKKPFIPTDTAIITPPPNGSWLEAAKGSNLVPKSMGLFANENEALNNVDLMYGEFAYAQVMHNPVSIALFMGEKWGLNFKDTKAIYQAVVFP